MKRSRKRADDFTIAWVCALPIELSAATVILDEGYDDIPELAQYVLGRIGSHNVVVTCLPAGQYGTNAAAVTAAELHSKFHRIQYWLMVGIGGAVPNVTNDIRLGDVVVSQPQDQHGGVIQYDLGKIGPDGHNVRTGVLNAPPAALGRAVSRMRSAHDIGKGKLQSHLAAFSQLKKFARPNNDVLFEADYCHIGPGSCHNCLPERQITRPDRADDDVVIHFGLIASGNQVIKDGVRRDRLSADLGGALCFEMEAAGLVNHFPCLVIRGICDYCDSHKNKQAQPFAAATAAACAKEVLSYVSSISTTTVKAHAQPSQHSLAESSVNQAVETESHGREDDIGSDGDGSGTLVDAPFVKLSLSDEQRQQFLDSLVFEDINTRHATIRQAHVKTCRWILKRKEYLSWLDNQHLSSHNGFFWIKGNPGTGKSTLMKFVLAKTLRAHRDATMVSFFFNARGASLEKTTVGLYRSILFQILERHREMQDVFTICRPKASSLGALSWDIDTLKTALEVVISQLKDKSLFVFVDALDECDENEVRDMVSMFEALGSMAIANKLWFRTCFSSRHYPHIVIGDSIQLVLEDQDDHKQDIAQYLHTELKAGHDDLVNEIRSEMLERSSGIFLWAVLVVQILNREFSRGNKHKMKQKLKVIPDGLEKLFEDILTRDKQDTAILVLCLQWVLFARRPLRLEELYFALRAGNNSDIKHCRDAPAMSRDDMRRYLLNTSKGLVEETKTKLATVQFIHESVRDFFLKGKGLSNPFFGPRIDFEARSHNELKQCCYDYIQNINFEEGLAPRSLLTDLPIASTPEAKVLRENTHAAFPFIGYAVNNVLYHCDQAMGLGLDQAAFMASFMLKMWIEYNNLLEPHEIRRYTMEASLLYIIADRALPNLVEVEFAKTKTMEIFGERYKFPLIAAQASGNASVVRNLITCQLEGKIDFTSSDIQGMVSELLTTKISVLKWDTSLIGWAFRNDIKSLWKLFLGRGRLNTLKLRHYAPWLLDAMCMSGDTKNVQKLLLFYSDSRSDLLLNWLRSYIPIANTRPTASLVYVLLESNSIDMMRLILEHAHAVRQTPGINQLFDRGLVVACSYGRLIFVDLFLAYEPSLYSTCFALNSVNRTPSDGDLAVLERLTTYLGGFESALKKISLAGDAVGFDLCSNAIEAILRSRKPPLGLSDELCGLIMQRVIPFDNAEVMKMLLLDGETGSLSTSKMRVRALIEATRSQLGGVLKMLVSYGVGIKRQGSSGAALGHAIHGTAVSQNYVATISVLRLLLDHVEDINETDADGYTALTVASRMGVASIVKLLIDAGAHINQQGSDSRSALFWAVNDCFVEVVELLLDHGATFHKVEDTLWTPLQSYFFGIDYRAIVRIKGIINERTVQTMGLLGLAVFLSVSCCDEYHKVLGPLSNLLQALRQHIPANLALDNYSLYLYDKYISDEEHNLGRLRKILDLLRERHAKDQLVKL